MAPARRANPKVKVIIKYPQWYDHFHERGYDVTRETADFERIWVGTETRDYADARWGGTVQYEAYFFDDGSWVVENFNDEQVAVKVDGESCTVGARGWQMQWRK